MLINKPIKLGHLTHSSSESPYLVFHPQPPQHYLSGAPYYLCGWTSQLGGQPLRRDVWVPGPSAAISPNPAPEEQGGKSLLSRIMKNRRPSARLKREVLSQRVYLAGGGFLPASSPHSSYLYPSSLPGEGPLPPVLQNEWFLIMPIFLAWPVSRWGWGRCLTSQDPRGTLL